MTQVIKKLPALLAGVVIVALPACAELKEAGHNIGQTTRNVTTDIGHGSRDTVHAIGKGAKRVVNSITADPPPDAQAPSGQ